MKTNLIVFGDFIGAELKELQKTIDCVSGGIIPIDGLEVFSNGDDLRFTKRLEDSITYSDTLIVIASEDLKFNVRQIIADKTCSDLLENENARLEIEQIASFKGQEPNLDYALMPQDATLIPNHAGFFQGFILEQEKFSIILLPKEYLELKAMCEGFVIPYFKTKYNINKKEFVFKFFGDRIKLSHVIDNCQNFYENAFTSFVTSKYNDHLVKLIFNDVDHGVVDSIKRKILLEINDGVYADFEVSLEQRLFDLLKLRGKRISVAESFTGGRISSSLVSVPGVSAYFNEGAVTYSNTAKQKRLGVKEEDLKTLGAVSTKVAYQMCTGLLLCGDCDIAISTTGIAGPNADGTDKPVGLCYIAVGMLGGIDVHKYQLYGTREEITETAKNTALFLAINKLKNI